MFEATKWTLNENTRKINEMVVVSTVQPPQVVLPKNTKNIQEAAMAEGIPSFSSKSKGIVRQFDFSSKLQRMSVVVRGLDEVMFRIHIKGSPEKIRELCIPETIPTNFHSILETYTQVQSF